MAIYCAGLIFCCNLHYRQVLGISSYLPSKVKEETKEVAKEDESKLKAASDRTLVVVVEPPMEGSRTVGELAEENPEDLKEMAGEGEEDVVKDKEEGEKQDGKEGQVDVSIQFAESAKEAPEEEVKEKMEEETKKEEESRKEKEAARILDGLEDEHKMMLKVRRSFV